MGNGCSSGIKNVDESEKDVNELFFFKCRAGKLEEIKKIYKSNSKNLNLNEGFSNEAQNMTALHVSCKKGFLEIVKFLLEKNADINAQCEFLRTPLHYAVSHGRKKIVEFILSKSSKIRNVNVMLTDIEGNTILHKACFYGHLEIVQNILSFVKNDEGVELKEYVNVTNELGRTCLHHCFRDHSQYERGGEKKSKIMPKIMEILIQSGVDMEKKDGNGETALFMATKLGDEGRIRLLLKMNVDKNVTNVEGKTAKDFIRSRSKFLFEDIKIYNTSIKEKEMQERILQEKITKAKENEEIINIKEMECESEKKIKKNMEEKLIVNENEKGETNDKEEGNGIFDLNQKKKVINNISEIVNENNKIKEVIVNDSDKSDK